MNLFNLSLKLKGFPIEKAKQDLVKIKAKTNTDFDIYVKQKKAHIVSYHLEHNSFYKKFAKAFDTNQWHNIPILRKSDLQTPLRTRLSKGFTVKNCHIHKTSGSSGTPLIFAKNKYAHAMSWAIFMDRYSMHNIDATTAKQARFYGIPAHGIAHYKERLKDVVGNRFRFSVFDLSEKQFKQNVLKFKNFSFEYINGYTSAIVQFAKYLEANNIILKEVCPTLKVCIVTAEMLFSNDKILLERQLGIPIVNEYGSAELSLIAFNSPQNQWLVNTEDLYVEIVDNNGKPLPYGEEGRVVVTSLYNKAHPFIRYELGDYGTLDKKSTNKIPLLKSLTGRTSDVIMLPSGKKAAGLTFYYITKTVIEDDANVKEFVIHQQAINTFKIIYVSKTKLSTAQERAIKNAIARYLEPNLIITLEKTLILKRTKAGKLKQFTSLL